MDDWEPGDIALCVKRHPFLIDNLVIGAKYTVKEVFWGFPVHPDDHGSNLALALHEINPTHPDADGYGADNFRKIGGRKIHERFMSQLVDPTKVKELT